MDMISALNSINQTKVNLMRDEMGKPIEAEEKSFPMFPVMRSLSYHPATAPLVNLINECGLVQFGLTPIMQYEFLLYAIPQGKRFAKWEKSQKDDDIDMVMELYSMSYDKARDVISFLTDSELNTMRSLKGGQTSTSKKK